jgi:hypothetical protein
VKRGGPFLQPLRREEQVYNDWFEWVALVVVVVVVVTTCRERGKVRVSSFSVVEGVQRPISDYVILPSTFG